MPETDQNKKSDFMMEKIKERPINRKKLLRRTLITAAMAVIFGLIACLTFLLLEPVLSNWLYPPEEPDPIIFPEDQEEMSPEEMLSDTAKEEEPIVIESVPLREQIREEIAKITFGNEQVQQMDRALTAYITDMSQCIVTIWDATDRYGSGTSISGVLIADNGQDYMIMADGTSLQETDRFIGVLYNEQRVQLKLQQRDPHTGLAIFALSHVSLPGELRDSLKVASLGFSSIRNVLGISVVALGKPVGIPGSVAGGLIAGAGTAQENVDANYDILVTDIPAFGQAEGFLFNLKGAVIGVITQSAEESAASNLLCAYGVSDLRKLVEKMINEQGIAYLGIRGTSVSTEAHEELKVPYGAYVRETVMESPAMLEGIQPGDVIVAINEENILDFDRYTSVLMSMKPGSRVDLTVMRQTQLEDDPMYQEMQFQITLEQVE
jgi:serine protease Do